MIKDYDCIIEYHLGKVNVVADALSMQSKKPKSSIISIRLSLLSELKSSGVVLTVSGQGSLLTHFHVKPILINDVVSNQAKYSVLKKIIEQVKLKQRTNYQLKDDGTLMKYGRLHILHPIL